MNNYENGVLDVSSFNELIKTHLNSVGELSVKGEITELKISPNKGVHITLSDKKSNLKLTGFAPRIKGINLVEKGMEVIAKGIPTIYVPYGNFSLEINSLEPQGEGALQVAYEKLKAQLQEEGLFEAKHKQALPVYIRKIALLTGANSAAYSDFVKILKENNQNILIDFYPVLVQGSNSVKDISKKLDFIFNKSIEYDVIVLTRGGGSLEDLKGFNDESIVRKIFNSRYRFIVAVGHEIDESLCDFVADVRASTPSQAAYYIASQNNNFVESLDNKINQLGNRITSLIASYNTKLDYSLRNMMESIQNKYDSFITSLETKTRLLESYNVEKVLKRGFAVIEGVGSNKGVIKSASELKAHDELEMSFYDGKVRSMVSYVNLYEPEYMRKIASASNQNVKSSRNNATTPDDAIKKSSTMSTHANNLFG